MKLAILNRTIIWLLILGLTGCATPQTPPEEPPLVYPPPPAEPRFIFERTLRFNENVQRLNAADKLKRLVTGVADDLQGLVKPFDVAAWGGRVYVSDTVQSIVAVFDIRAGRYFEIGKEDPGHIDKPLGLSVSPTGELYVVDAGRKRVAVYNADGQFLRSIGDAQILDRPSDTVVDSARNRLYVIDTGGVESVRHQIAVFDLASGSLIQTIGTRGEKSGELNLPLQAALAPDGTLLVVDSGNFRVQGFNPDGSVKVTFGTLGRYPGQFARPKGIGVDRNGNSYVVDTAFGNFQIFDPAGQLLLFVGQHGASSKPGNYVLPAGITLDEDGRVYVVDQYFRKVDIYRPATLGPLDGAAVFREK